MVSVNDGFVISKATSKKPEPMAASHEVHVVIIANSGDKRGLLDAAAVSIGSWAFVVPADCTFIVELYAVFAFFADGPYRL